MSNKTARSTDTPSSTTAPTKTPRRTRVTHLYWVQQARLAQAVGLPTAYLCGRWAKRRTSPDTDPRLEVIGDGVSRRRVDALVAGGRARRSAGRRPRAGRLR